MPALVLCASAVAFAFPVRTFGAEATTGIITGAVFDAQDHPIQGARVSAAAPSGGASATADARGRFSLLGLAPDTYAIAVEANGFERFVEGGLTVLPGQSQQLNVHLVRALSEIGRVRASGGAFALGSNGDTFTVSGADARAIAPPVSSAGLAAYSAGSVQGAIASVPGVALDPFGNAILRAGKVDDAVFTYDSVPVPQGLIAEPGGNV